MGKIVRNLVVLTMVSLLVTMSAAPQATIRGQVHGSVADPGGALVPSAEVTLTNLQTGISRRMETSAVGTFVFPLVDPGFYKLTVEKQGFKLVIVEQVQVTAQAPVLVDVSLELGEVTQEVVVSAQTEVLNVREASISALITSTELREIPLNDKQYVNFIRLEPGVVPGNIVTGSSGGRDFGDGGYVHGKRIFDNVASIDGGAFYDPWIPSETVSTLLAGPGVSAEAIDEFRLYGNNPPPSEGFTYGARINVSTKSGGNDLHGSVYHFLRNDALDARSFFEPESFPLKRNVFGFTVGGPIQRDKTFFFGNYEGLRQSRIDPRVPLVPTPTLLAAIPGGAANGFLREILEAVYPDPPAGSFGPGDLVVPISSSANRGLDYDLFLVRIDHAIGEKHYLTFRYSFDEAQGEFGTVFASGVPATDIGASNRWQQQIANWTTIFSPTLQNEFRFNYHREFNNFPVRDTPDQLVQCCGFTASPATSTALPTILETSTGLAPAGSFPGVPQFRSINLFQFNDTVSIIKGSHSLKFGVDVMTQNVNDFFPQDIRPFAIFIGLGPPFDASTFGLTTGTFFIENVTFPVNPPTLIRGLRRRQFALHVQDTWQVRPGLTIDLGLRYELVGRPYEVDNLMNNLFQLDSSGNPLPEARITDISNVALVQTGDCSGCLDLHHRDKADFAPRLGIVWSPRPSTAIRAGFGIQYGQLFMNPFSFNRNNPPFSRGVLLVGQQFGTDILSGPAIDPPLAVYDPAWRRPYYMEWNIAFQQQVIDADTFVELAYVANRGNRMVRPLTPNFGLGFPGVRPNPNFGRIVQWVPGSDTWYDSLQAQFTRKFSKGLAFQFSYTYSKSLDESSGEIFGFGDFNFPTDPQNPEIDKGPSDFDMPHVFVTNFVYELPIGREKPFLSDISPWANAVLGGWQVMGIVTLHSGQRLTFFSGLDNNLDGHTGNDRAGALVSNFSTLFDTSGLDATQFFNPAAVGTEISSTLGGTLGRNTHHGPSFQNFDFSLHKKFNWGERYGFQFRVEFFNILNHTNFDQPVSIVSSPLFGLITATRNPGRQLQTTLKLTF